jgi:hypothetical protein
MPAGIACPARILTFRHLRALRQAVESDGFRPLDGLGPFSERWPQWSSGKAWVTSQISWNARRRGDHAEVKVFSYKSFAISRLHQMLVAVPKKDEKDGRFPALSAILWM